MESNVEQSITHVWDKSLMIVGFMFGSISLVDVKESIQMYSLIVGAICLTLSLILYILKIRKEFPSVKEHIKDEIKKNCP